MKRREFIILSSIGATSASLLSACGHPEEKLIPAFIPDDEYVPGIDYWKASTCGMCPAGCGIIVRTREHKANKIEGNPIHPVNRGALCALGQAGLEVLYNPDRIKGPMKRVGEHGEGKWQEISWDEGIKMLADNLREIDPHNANENALFISGEAEGVTALVAGRFMQACGQAFVAEHSHHPMEPPGIYPDLLSGVVKPGEPIADIANATYLVSFAARFLETWKSPVMYSQAYGEFRSSRGKVRGKFIHIEPRMSLTAANADEWIAAAPGAEALVALAMVQVIVREGLNKAPVSNDSRRQLEEFAPENTASMIDVSLERIIRVAREFAKAERPVAIGDLRSPDGTAVHLLNAMVENQNKPGGVLLFDSGESSKGPLGIAGNGLILPGESNEEPAKPGSREIGALVGRVIQMAQHPSRILMIHDTNPMFAKRGREDYRAIPFIVSFSSFMDETSESADLILPDHTYLERWDIHSSWGPDGRKAFSLTQPVLEAQLNTRQTADVLLAVAREMGGAVAEALPFDSAKDIIEKRVAELVSLDHGESGEMASSEVTEKGVVFLGALTQVKTEVERKPLSLDSFFLRALRQHATEGVANAQYPLMLIVYEHLGLGSELAANLPSIQELPDPMTSVMWGSWVEINPKTASTMGIADGDLVEVSTTNGSVRGPAVLYPGIRPDCIAMPTGQGHSSYGRYARGRGVDPTELLSSSEETSVRSSLTKVGGKAQLIRFGTDVQELMEKRPWR
jgi:anaerobic selenocysteine-containing dehydrogenase